jgi:hypothetical protein
MDIGVDIDDGVTQIDLADFLQISELVMICSILLKTFINYIIIIKPYNILLDKIRC